MTNPTPHGQVPEALRLAHIFDHPLPPEWPDMVAAAAELRRQHARIAELEARVQELGAMARENRSRRIVELEAELEAVSAGGVQALSAAQTLPESFLRDVVMLCNNQGASPESIESFDREDKWIADLWRTANTMLAASPTPPAEQPTPNTGHAEADRLIGRLMSSDPDFEDCRQAAALIQREIRGPDGFGTWRDAAIAERLARVNLQAAPKAAPGELHDHQILAITTAYEQGVGKGRQAYGSGKEISNPYGTGYRCDLAWQYGYKEGKEQAERIAKAAPQQEEQEPTAFIHWPINGPPRLVWYSQKALNDAILKTHEDGYKPDVKLYTEPQPAPDCHHRPPCAECAALAAQGGKDA